MRAAKSFSIIGGLLMLSGISLAGYRWTQAPATGRNTTLHINESSTVLGSQTRLTGFETDEFVTQLPAQLHLKTKTENPTGPIRGSYLFTSALRTRSDQLAITYGLRGTNQLQELAAVKLRLGQPEQYRPVQLSGLPESALAFSRQDEYETSAFWQSGDRYVAVVASGTAEARADMDEALHAVTGNWQWR